MFKSPASNLPSWKQLRKELACWAQGGRGKGCGGKRLKIIWRSIYNDLEYYSCYIMLYQYIISIDLWHGVLFRIILLTFTMLNWWKCEPADYLSNYPQAPTRISNLNTAQAVHIFVLVHVKQVCQVFPAPTHQCVVQMKYCIRSTQDLALIRAETKRFHKLLCSTVSVCVHMCVCVSYIHAYTTLRPRASMKLSCSIFDQFLGRKTGAHQHFRRLGTWRGTIGVTNSTDRCEQPRISEDSYFLLHFEQYPCKSVTTCYLLHSRLKVIITVQSQQMKDWGTKDYQIKSVALLIP